MTYRYVSRFYLMWTLFFSLIVSICMIICGSVPWQTTILEMALIKTKAWQFHLGLFILLLCILGFFAMEAGSKGLSWLYVFCTIALCLVSFVHAWIDIDAEEAAASRTENLLIMYFNHYEKVSYNEVVDNFQRRMRCCGLQNRTEMIRGSKCVYVASCCHRKPQNCTEDSVHKKTCFKRARHTIHLLRLCAALGVIAGCVQALVLFVLLLGGIKYLYQLIFPPGGPIVEA